DEVWELHWVAHEEDWGVVSDQVEVAFFGVELQGKSTHVAPCIWRAQFTGNGGETSQHFGFHARLEHGSLGVLRYVFGDLEGTKSAGAFGVWTTLWDVHAVEVLQGFDQVSIVQDDWAIWTNG